MVDWSVSEPYIILQLHDKPLWYNPPIGPGVAFELFYRQIGSLPEDTNIFSAGSGWSCSLRSFIAAPNWSSDGSALLHRGGAGWIPYNSGQPQVRDGSQIAAVTGGYQINYPDGRVDTFTEAFDDDNGTNAYFITSSADPQGNSLTFNYLTEDGLIRLNTVTDAIGQTTQFVYENPNFPNLITRVVDPFSRTSYLTYNTNGFLTNIADVAGLNSSVIYDYVSFTNSGPGPVVTNLTTPYGTTSFRYDGYNYYGGEYELTYVSDAIEVTLPTGAKDLTLLLFAANFLDSWNPTPPDTGPFANTFETNNPMADTLVVNNSYHWGPLQYEALSSGYLSTDSVLNLTNNDFAVGRLRHWLDLSAALSLEQAPYP